jgi:hypothetical protein
MNELDHLNLLKKTLEDSNISTAQSMGDLASDIESIRSLLDDVSEEFVNSFSILWAALEVVAVAHQEQNTEPSKNEIDDLEALKHTLMKCTEREIASRVR